ETSRLAGGRKTLRFENRFAHKDGSHHWLSWKAVPDQGRIYGTARDVTELKDAEQRLEEARRELAQVTRRTTLAAMAASIAHEINQPLAAIVMNAKAGMQSLIGATPDLADVRTVLTEIVNEGHRASDILTSVRAMFRKERHEGLPLNVNDLVRDVLTLAHRELECHRIAVQIGLCEGLPAI